MMKRALLALILLCGVLGAAEEKPRVAVMGDSYSTFQGYIPRGYAVYYPRSGVDVTRAEECWWHIVIRTLGGTLERNDSWSGSTICNSIWHGMRDVSYSSFLSRTTRLGDPTLILICGGTNDAWHQSPLGEYKYEKWTRRDLNGFRPALAKLFSELGELYPKAKIVFILNSELPQEYNDSVHTVCAHYRIPCVDLKEIDKQKGHPSVAGMKAFADQVLKVVQK